MSNCILQSNILIKSSFFMWYILRKDILRSDKEILQSKLKKFWGNKQYYNDEMGNKQQYYNDESGLQPIKSYVTTGVLCRMSFYFFIHFVVSLIYVILSFHFFFQIFFQDNKSTCFIIMKQDHRPLVNSSSNELKSQTTLQASCFSTLLLTFFFCFFFHHRFFYNVIHQTRL